MEYFLSLQKVDEERRLVYGRAIHEVVDRTNEIIDYETAKPAFEKWSKQFEEMTGGLSKGNVRIMHSPRDVAGKLIDLKFNDDEKAIDVVAKVVDDDAWKKVLAGVLTGFSVGGGYGRKWKDEETGATRYTPIVSEISLVDNPCIPTARIVELAKRDGSVTSLHLTGRVRSFEDIYKPHRSFTEVMLEKGLVSIGGRAGRFLGGKFADAGKKANSNAYNLAAARKYQDLRMSDSISPDRYPANYRDYRAMRGPESTYDRVESKINRAGAQAVIRRKKHLRNEGARIGKNATRYGIGAVVGGGAVALTDAQRRQRSEAGKASAEKRRNRAGD